MEKRNTCRIVQGRLMEIDVAVGYRTVADVDEMIGLIGSTLAAQPSRTRVVIAADWRPCKLFTPEVAARALTMLSGVNPRIERSGILHREDQATSVLQVMRLVKESHHPNRRVFTDTTLMGDWLCEVLDLRESRRLREFLSRSA